MPYYETVFIARQDLSSKQVEDLTTQFSEIITKEGGKIHKIENWGLRTLAYKINKSRKAHYVMIESETEAPALLEMERQMRLNEDVMRFMSLREDELSDGPSVMVRKDDRDRDIEHSNKDDEKEAA